MRALYVALTRAERVLLVSGHRWGPTGDRPRQPSVFLSEVRATVEATGAGRVEHWAEEPEDGMQNPATAEPVTAEWPVDPLGARAAAVHAGAELVRAAIRAQDADDATSHEIDADPDGAAHENADPENADPENAGPENADGRQGAWRDTLEGRHAQHLALAEEGVTHGARLAAVHQRQERRALARQPIGERQRDCQRDRLGSLDRRELPARLLAHRRHRRLERGRVICGHRQRTGAAQGPADQCAREAGRLRPQVALRDPIRDTERQRLPRRHLAAARDHVERSGQADQARQSLGGAGAGDEAQLHLGQTDARIRRHDTRVARQRRAMPQYAVGHLERVAAIERRLDAWPAFQLAGAAYRGVGIPDCIRSGETAADAVLDALGAAR